ALFAAAWAVASPAQAAFPEKPVTLVVAFPPGGGADVVARLVGTKLAVALQQPVVVDNRAGASGNIASEAVARAPADGHTLLMHNNTLTLNASIGMRQSFNLRKDLVPLAAVASTPIVVAVHPSVPARTIDELIAYARANPDKLSYSSCGNGTAQHFAGVQFSKMAAVKMVHIPFKGCAPPVIDGLSGTVPVLFNTVPNLDAHVKAGRLRFLGVASAKRLPFLPDLPTVGETPALRGFVAEVWFGFFAPSGTPKPVLARLERELIKVMDGKEIQDAFVARRMSRTVLDAQQLGKQVEADLVNWKRLADEFKVVPE
ncbi:MAG: tripartite tricarboxylate transporter substrate binding protein, partial [Burkholderiales bacterium]